MKRIAQLIPSKFRGLIAILALPIFLNGCQQLFNDPQALALAKQDFVKKTQNETISEKVYKDSQTEQISVILQSSHSEIARYFFHRFSPNLIVITDSLFQSSQKMISYHADHTAAGAITQSSEEHIQMDPSTGMQLERAIITQNYSYHADGRLLYVFKTTRWFDPVTGKLIRQSGSLTIGQAELTIAYDIQNNVVTGTHVFIEGVEQPLLGSAGEVNPAALFERSAALLLVRQDALNRHWMIQRQDTYPLDFMNVYLNPAAAIEIESLVDKGIDAAGKHMYEITALVTVEKHLFEAGVSGNVRILTEPIRVKYTVDVAGGAPRLHKIDHNPSESDFNTPDFSSEFHLVRTSDVREVITRPGAPFEWPAPFQSDEITTVLYENGRPKSIQGQRLDQELGFDPQNPRYPIYVHKIDWTASYDASGKYVVSQDITDETYLLTEHGQKKPYAYETFHSVYGPDGHRLYQENTKELQDDANRPATITYTYDYDPVTFEQTRSSEHWETKELASWGLKAKSSLDKRYTYAYGIYDHMDLTYSSDRYLSGELSSHDESVTVTDRSVTIDEQGHLRVGDETQTFHTMSENYAYHGILTMRTVAQSQTFTPGDSAADRTPITDSSGLTTRYNLSGAVIEIYSTTTHIQGDLITSSGWVERPNQFTINYVFTFPEEGTMGVEVYERNADGTNGVHLFSSLEYLSPTQIADKYVKDYGPFQLRVQSEALIVLGEKSDVLTVSQEERKEGSYPLQVPSSQVQPLGAQSS